MADPRYSRQIALDDIGEAGQQRLAGGHVLLVGVGGLGCPAALYLAGAGVGRLTLCDHDTVDATNLARQVLYQPGDVDRPKVEAARDHLAKLTPAVEIQTVQQRMTADDLVPRLGAVDLVVDGSDNFATRLAVNQACLATRTPWVMGAAVRFEGQLAVFRPDQEPAPCYRCSYGEAATSLDDCHGAGVFAPLTGTMGAAMAGEAIRVLLGMDTEPRLSLFDARGFEWRQLALQTDPDCPACAHG